MSEGEGVRGREGEGERVCEWVIGSLHGCYLISSLPLPLSFSLSFLYFSLPYIICLMLQKIRLRITKLKLVPNSLKLFLEKLK